MGGERGKGEGERLEGKGNGLGTGGRETGEAKKKCGRESQRRKDRDRGTHRERCTKNFTKEVEKENCVGRPQNKRQSIHKGRKVKEKQGKQGSSALGA